MRTALFFLLFLLSATIGHSADPTADITVIFTGKQGPPESATLPAAKLSGVTHTVPLDLPFALRLVEVSVTRDEDSKEIDGLKVALLDPGTMLPGAPNVSPHPLTLMSSVVKFEVDRDIVVFKSSNGDWSVRLSNLSKP